MILGGPASSHFLEKSHLASESIGKKLEDRNFKEDEKEGYGPEEE